MLTLKNDPKFKKYLEEIEVLMPGVTPVELKLIKKYYRRGVSAYDTIHDMLNFM